MVYGKSILNKFKNRRKWENEKNSNIIDDIYTKWYAFYDNPYTNNNRVVIKSFDDFCVANYGITKKGKALNSIIYEIPKSMFINKTGNIIFFLKANYLSNGKDLHYKIVDDKIMFSTRKMD